ncbi:MAG: TPR end-of-group domain-containing protein [Gemmatimonadota bacterium]
MQVPSFERLKQRKFVQWSIAYLAVAWLLLQVLDLLAASFHWPDGVVRAATVLLAAGFVATVILAWYHGEQGRQKVTAVEVALIAAILALAAVAATMVSRPTAVVPEPTAPATPSAEIEPGTIAVMPFVNRSAARENEYFSDGITEEILSTLARIPGLQVRARSSSFAFKGKDLPVQEIARQLRVAHVLEGSVQRAGTRVRITAQLLDARTDRHLWSESFDRELKDIFAVEDEISAAIADALRTRLGAAIGEHMPPVRTQNPRAHEFYLRGRYLLAKASEAAVDESYRMFERAVQLDPNYAAAYAGMAEAFLLSTPTRRAPQQMEKARAAAQRSIELDARQPEAHAVLGAVLLWNDWNATASERELKRALELNPNAGNARDYYAWLLQVRGDRAGALRTVEEAVRLEPYSAWLSYALEFRYVLMRDFDRAIRQHSVTAKLDPSHFFWDLPVAMAYREKGDYQNAVEHYRRVEERLKGRPLHGLAITYARMGRTADARRMLQRLEEVAAREYVPPEQIAMIHANLGNHDRAVEWLERAFAMKSGWLLGWAEADPSYDPLRADPRFQALLARIRIR